MKTIDTALDAHLRARGTICPHVALWIEAVARIDGLPAPWGIWTGDDDRIFTIDGTPRLYWGAGALDMPGDLSAETGYVVRLLRLQLAHFHDDVAGALASTDIRLARATLHQLHLVAGSHDLVAPPLRRWKGRVETITLPTPAQGAQAMAEAQLASAARDLTLPLPITKSDATLRALHPADGFYRYIAISGKVTTAWGELNATQPTGGGGSGTPSTVPGG